MTIRETNSPPYIFPVKNNETTMAKPPQSAPKSSAYIDIGRWTFEPWRG